MLNWDTVTIQPQVIIFSPILWELFKNWDANSGRPYYRDASNSYSIPVHTKRNRKHRRNK